MEYVGWAYEKYIECWGSSDVLFAPRFYGLKGVCDHKCKLSYDRWLSRCCFSKFRSQSLFN